MKRFFVCPLVWQLPKGLAVAVFCEQHRSRAKAIARTAPYPPPGGWKVFPKIGLELLGWLREVHADGISWVLLDPHLSDETGTVAGYKLDISELLSSGKTLAMFEHLGGLPPEGDGPR
jgi:hypothetical protein